MMQGKRDWKAGADQLVEFMVLAEAPVAVFTNKVGQGIAPEAKHGRQFRHAQGFWNQRPITKVDFGHSSC